MTWSGQFNAARYDDILWRVNDAADTADVADVPKYFSNYITLICKQRLRFCRQSDYEGSDCPDDKIWRPTLSSR